MSENTSIEWCDHTWTPIVGCAPVSPACANCYAALMAARLEAMGHEKYRGVAVRVGGKGKWTGQVNFSEADLVKPLTVRRPGRWFLTSMGDVAHESVTPEQLAELFGVMAVAGRRFSMPRGHGGPHTFMVLTKRPERLALLLRLPGFRRMVGSAALRWAHDRVDKDWLADGITSENQLQGNDGFWPLPNVLIGCTAENQECATERLPAMRSIAAGGWRTFVSYEPALGPVDWTGWEFLKQLISGGESDHKARPSHPDWHRGARDFAATHGIAYLFKQWGEWCTSTDMLDQTGDSLYTDDLSRLRVAHMAIGIDGRTSYDANLVGLRPETIYRIGKKAAGRRLDGVEHNGFPEVNHG